MTNPTMTDWHETRRRLGEGMHDFGRKDAYYVFPVGSLTVEEIRVVERAGGKFVESLHWEDDDD